MILPSKQATHETEKPDCYYAKLCVLIKLHKCSLLNLTEPRKPQLASKSTLMELPYPSFAPEPASFYPQCMSETHVAKITKDLPFIIKHNPQKHQHWTQFPDTGENHVITRNYVTI